VAGGDTADVLLKALLDRGGSVLVGEEAVR
jgi:hypothetical protein